MTLSFSRVQHETGANARERLLAIATPLFAQHGRAGLSVRQITTAAGVNLAAVNYHFGSKDGLFHAVCLQHLRSNNERRLELLDALEKETAPAVPSVEKILEAYIRPVVEKLLSSDTSHLLLTRLIMNEAHEPSSSFVKLMRDEVQPVSQRFLELLQRAIPGADIVDLSWGLWFYTGTLLQGVMCLEKLSLFYPVITNAKDPEALIQRMIVHGAAGLRALTAKKS